MTNRPIPKIAAIGKQGFALVEILVALAILSIILTSVYSGISSGIKVISGAKNYTKAMLIAQTKLNEFRMAGYRAPDASMEPVEEYPNFFYSRTTEDFEDGLFAVAPAKQTLVTVTWRENDKERKYTLSFIYQSY